MRRPSRASPRRPTDGRGAASAAGSRRPAARRARRSPARPARRWRSALPTRPNRRPCRARRERGGPRSRRAGRAQPRRGTGRERLQVAGEEQRVAFVDEQRAHAGGPVAAARPRVEALGGLVYARTRRPGAPPPPIARRPLGVGRAGPLEVVGHDGVERRDRRVEPTLEHRRHAGAARRGVPDRCRRGRRRARGRGRIGTRRRRRRRRQDRPPPPRIPAIGRGKAPPRFARASSNVNEFPRRPRPAARPPRPPAAAPAALDDRRDRAGYGGRRDVEPAGLGQQLAELPDEQRVPGAAANDRAAPGGDRDPAATATARPASAVEGRHRHRGADPHELGHVLTASSSVGTCRRGGRGRRGPGRDEGARRDAVSAHCRSSSTITSGPGHARPGPSRRRRRVVRTARRASPPASPPRTRPASRPPSSWRSTCTQSHSGGAPSPCHAVAHATRAPVAADPDDFLGQPRLADPGIAAQQQHRTVQIGQVRGDDGQLRLAADELARRVLRARSASIARLRIRPAPGPRLRVARASTPAAFTGARGFMAVGRAGPRRRSPRPRCEMPSRSWSIERHVPPGN